MSTLRSASVGAPNSGVSGGSDNDLASRLYRQGGGQQQLPRLVSTGGRQPFVGGLSTTSADGVGGGLSTSSANLRKANHLQKSGQQVLVPHTIYRPITLPSIDGNLSPPLNTTKSGARLLGTRNASVPMSMVGKQNIPGQKKSVDNLGKEDSKVLSDGEVADGEVPKVDPADPSWISPADFVEFILNHESLTEEFCYMNRSGPYEFEIVPFSKINPNDYMTISIRGVTHYANGELDYQDLSEWQRDQEMYRKIIRIAFFEKYQRWKLFSVWKSAMRNQRVQKCSRTLNAHLFALDMTLCDSLLECRKLCVKLQSYNLLAVNPVQQPISLEEFEKNQITAREEVVQNLKVVWTHIKDELHQSCTKSLELFLKANGFDKKAEKEDAKSGDDTAREATERDDEANGMTYTERATTRTQCRKLTKFIRMVQYLFNDAIAVMVRHTTQKLLELLDGYAEDEEAEHEVEVHASKGGGHGAHDEKRRAGGNKPKFVIECLLEAHGLRFQPPGRDVRECIETCLRDGLHAVSGMPAFLQVDDFLPFTTPLAELGDVLQLEEQQSDLYGLVHQDPKYKDLMKRIGIRFDALFKRVVDYADGYRHFVDIYTENQALQDCSVTFADATLEDFRNALGKYRQEMEDIRAMGRSKDIGLFRLDSKRMQDTLLPSPMRCNELLATYVPELAMKRNEELSSEIKAHNDRLSQYPNNVDEYVEFNIHLSKVDTDMPSISKRYDEIQEMAEIIREYGIRVDNDTRKAFSDLAASMKQMVMQLSEGKQQSDTNVAHFSQALANDIPELEKRVKETAARLEHADFSDKNKMKGEARKEVLKMLDEIESDVQKAKEDGERFNRYQDVLKVEPTPFDDVDELKLVFAGRAKLWRNMESWDELSEDWMKTSFGSVQPESIQKKVAEYNKIAVQSQKAMPTSEVPNLWFDTVKKFKDTLPVVVDLRNKALKERHWEVITSLIGQKLDLEDDTFTLGNLLEMGVDKHMEAIHETAVNASKERDLEEMLAKVENSWKDLDLIVNPYKESKDVFILGAVDDIVTALEDSLVTVGTIAGSPFVGFIRDDVEQWQKNLLLFQETLDEWLMVQRNWMYLESIFGAGDIKKQLPTESAKFMEIDTTWKQIMKETREYSVALVAATKPGRLEVFKNANETLDQIQKQLEDYLLSKCVAFPRFFFLSNEELLEILSQARRPQAVQPHLRKCFDNLVKLRFGDDARSTEITHMISGENEEIQFFKPLKARGHVEKWLSSDGGVEDFMVRTLREVTKNSWKEYETMPRKDWVRVQYVQVMITVGSIYWTRDTELVFQEDEAKRVPSMGNWLNKNKSQLQGLTELIREKLSSNQRKGVVALVTQDVHNRDIIDDLYTNQVSSINNFKWQQQLRFYWDMEEDDCVIRQVDAYIRYGHEYQGALTRLVITPLTDRCWMTITGALHIYLGAAPAGPAGTGKTESTKDLAKGIARQCVVFNCSDQIDYKMMGKLYSGVVSAGSWTCLDEFNRISIEVLSVVAQQVLEIRQALQQKLQEFVFEQRQLRVRPTCGIFITMNPGYAGRTELPDNLKVLFRPVSMMVPDYTLIAEIMLYAEGFGQAKLLSGKFTQLYKLSSEQLSKQDHYDFGMRAVKSVLVMAGALKREDPDMDEQILLIRAMRDSNVPKFLSQDLPLFFAIINDLFPAVEVPFIDYGALQTAIEKSMVEQSLQVHDKLVIKTIQLFETFNVRFGVMLVGPTLGGKSTDYKTLALALSHLREDGHPDEKFQKVVKECLNPKAISMGELYGECNELTQEWTDGLGSKIMRGYVGEETPDWKWTIFDGPVDAIWIESMNTVLDDNKTLCLANGERVKLNDTMRMLFEVEDLKVASPATVSRCGMVYLTASDLAWKPYVQTWLAGLPEEPFGEKPKEMIWNLFDTYVDKALEWLRKNAIEPVVTQDAQLVIGCCNLFSALFNDEAATAHGASSKDAQGEEGPVLPRKWKDIDPEEFEKFITPGFCWAFTWSIGGSCDAKSRNNFSREIEQYFQNVTWSRNGGPYDGYLDFHKDPKFKSWTDLVPGFVFQEGVSYFQLLVPNADTVRFSMVMDKMMSVQSSVFLTGVSGVGKSVIIGNLLQNMQEHAHVNPVPMAFSAQSKAYQTQTTIEGKLEKRKKTLLSAPVNKTVVILIDDVNMPLVEEYGAQPPIELLRQLQDQRGFWDRKQHFWKGVQNATLLLCAAPPGGGRNIMTPRFTRHSMVLCMPSTSEEAMQVIFGSIASGFLQRFKQEIQGLSNAAVAGTIEMYNRCEAELLPTPTRPHYTFNLRDISKVFQGILMVKPLHVPNADAFTRLWFHELSRVFCDRLIDANDKEWFMNVAAELLKARFRVADTSAELWQSVIFCDFLRPIDSRVYEEAKDRNKVVKVLEDANDEYNLSHTAQMNLVFFKDCLEHICRIARVFRQPRGNVLLVGVGGSGRSSCARLCACMSETAEFEIALTKGYGIDAFREDEKKFLCSAGVTGEQTMFLINDTQIIDQTFLEDLNNILNAGEVPNLFPSDEAERVVGEVRPKAKDAGRSEARDAVWLYFIDRVRENLHIVLTMSPVGSALRIRMRNFPALVNCCTIDWFLPWPDEALLGVSARLLENPGIEDDMRTALSQACCAVHQSVIHKAEIFLARLRRQVYVTPKSFLDLIDLYLEMLIEKKDEKDLNLRRLQTGVEKIDEANAVVNGLQEDLTKLAPFIATKIKETDELVPVVKDEQGKAEVIKEKVSGEEMVVREQTAQVKAIQEDAQRDLDVAMPALESALKSLDALDKKDIGEIKSFPKPPPLVMMTMEAVCLLLGEKTDWDAAKKALSDPKFIDRLKGYDKDNIPPKILKQLEKYVTKPEYTPESVGNQSKASKSLCMWTHAMDTYSKVAKEVEPKKQRLAEMNNQLNEANRKLKEKQDGLREVEEQVASLQKRLSDTIAEKEKLESEAALTKARLQRADVLTLGLADEGVRWRETVGTIRQEIINLTGDVFLSSASISYYGPFTGVYRNEIVDEWLEACKKAHIPTGETFDLRAVMGNPVTIRQWNLQGLPADSVSVNNGVLTVRGKRWPLMIDPQSQGNKWIKKKEGKELKNIKMTHAKMLLILEQCIRMGSPLLMEDIGEILDPALEPVLLKAVFENAGRLQIKLGDQDVDYDKGFLFYLTTKMPNPHYFPEVCIKVTVINFTVTFDGLEEQLLSEVVSKEIPEVLQKRTELMLQMADDKKTLQQLEDTILRLLSESTGNILDDEVLIKTLAESKEKSTAINIRVKEAAITATEIEAACNEYTQVATSGSLLYFVIADLANINPMYQFSLTYFIRLFNRCIDLAKPSDDLDVRLTHLINSMLNNIFINVCRGLFEDNKLTFAFLLATSFQRHYHEINAGEWSLLLRGVGTLDMSKKPPNPDPDFFTEKMWEVVYALQCVGADHCGCICEHVEKNLEDWKDWAQLDEPHLESLPLNYDEENELHYIHQFLLIKAMCPEKVIFAVQEHTRRSMGESFIIFPTAVMSDLYGDSSKSTPIVFVLSPGADPTYMLLRFAAEMNMEETMGKISLGQGQGPKASKMIDEACKKGTWVLLQNCHLAKSWMPTLEKICEGFEESAHIHKDFRLFLTSMPADYFPVPILQNGVKLTIEPPKGLRANVLRSFQAQTDEELRLTDPSKELAWRRIQFGLKFFHAVVQERRKFGPLGFNIRYEFNDSDLETSTVVTRNMLEIEGDVPWDTLLFVIGHINYGGRVTDDKDRRCLLAILEQYVSVNIIDPNYLFSQSGSYKCPPNSDTADVAGFSEFVKGFPLTELPEVFGMHENANVSFMQQESDKLIGVVLSIQPRESGGGGGKSSEDIVSEIAGDQGSRIPALLTSETAHASTFIIDDSTGLMNSLGTCLTQEMARFNGLLKRLQSTLRDVQKAIKGTIVMTGELDAMFSSVLNNQVPSLWESVGYPSLKPLSSYYEDMILRVEFFREWVENGQPNAFWISSMFFPQGFLTSVLQAFSRGKMIPVDQLSFETIPEGTDDPTEIDGPPKSEGSIFVHGLFLDGAAWEYEDGGPGAICDQEFGTMYVRAPVLSFIPYRNRVPDTAKYSCPLYKTSVRAGTLSTTGHSTNFVMFIDVETDRHPNYWILRGAAMLTMLND